MGVCFNIPVFDFYIHDFFISYIYIYAIAELGQAPRNVLIYHCKRSWARKRKTPEQPEIRSRHTAPKNA